MPHTTSTPADYAWLSPTDVVRLALSSYYGLCRRIDEGYREYPDDNAYPADFAERLTTIFGLKIQAHGRQTGLAVFPDGLDEYLDRMLRVSLPTGEIPPNTHRAQYRIPGTKGSQGRVRVEPAYKWPDLDQVKPSELRPSHCQQEDFRNRPQTCLLTGHSAFGTSLRLMQHPIRSARRVLSSVMLCSACVVVHAAPATSEELNGTPAADPGSPSITRTPSAGAGAQVPVTSSVPQSKTVELLLQMQDQPNLMGADGKSAGDSPRRPVGVTPGKPSAAKEAESESNPLANLKATILGTQTQAAPSAHASDREQSEREARRSSTAGNTGGYPSGAGTGEPRESLLANPVIRFIRENRSLVVGVSLAVLIGIWGTATFSMRRSR